MKTEMERNYKEALDAIRIVFETRSVDVQEVIDSLVGLKDEIDAYIDTLTYELE